MTEVAPRLRSSLADRYSIERELGAGGMATVYLAVDRKHHRKVAVKVLRPELAAALGPARFTREIEIAAQLQHPHILPLLDSGEADGFLYYVMPYIEGESLRERLVRQGELPVPEALRLLCEIVDAVAHAHARGVVHRDIKPDNVMLSGRHALVMDFGVAKAVSEATGRQQLTTAGVALGTPAYMAPEQATADPHLDHRVDIYAIGAVAYELLAGRPPFTAASSQQVLAAHVTQPPEPLSWHRPGISPGLSQIVMKCLEKRPADRYQSADDLLAQLEPLVTPSGGVTPSETRPVAVAGRPAVPLKFWLGVAGLAAAAVVAGLIVMSRRPPELAIGRRTQLTLEPGLELDAAISPDGKFVAYASGSVNRTGLFLRQLDGTGAVSLTPDSIGYFRRPLWSPDGSRIAFQVPGGIAVVGALGGPPKTLVDSARTMAWSPDGTRIAFTLHDTLFTRAMEGGARAALATGFALYSPAWSPDGKWIAFVSGNYEFAFGQAANLGNIAPSQVKVVSAKGGAPIALTDNASLNVSPVWMPRGRELLFVSNRDGGRDVYRLALRANGSPAGTAARLTTGLDAFSISLSSDGKRLAYSTYKQTANIWSAPLDGREPFPSSRATPVTTGSQIIESVAISPDGRWLAFDSDRSGNQDLYRMPAGGGAPEQLTSDPQGDFRPAWSLDGKQLAFHSFRNGNRDIFVIPAAGGAAQPVVTGPQQERNASWSPDGTRIAFEAYGTGAAPEVMVTTRSGGRWGEPRRISHGGGSGPRFSPDGKLVAYAKGADFVTALPDGNDERPVASSEDSLQLIGTCEWSADGKGLYVEAVAAGGEPGLWLFPVSKGSPRQVIRLDQSDLGFQPGGFAVRGDMVYLPLTRRESDIWTAEIVSR